MYTAEFDEQTLSKIYDVDESIVRDIVRIVKQYSDECIASVVVRIRNRCSIDLKNYKHTILIGHIIGVVSTGIYERDLIKNLHNICLREN